LDRSQVIGLNKTAETKKTNNSKLLQKSECTALVELQVKLLY